MSIYQDELEMYPIIPSNVNEKNIIDFSKRYNIPLKGVNSMQNAWERLRTFIIIRNNIINKKVPSNLTNEMMEDYMNTVNIYNDKILDRQGKWNVLRNYNISQLPPEMLDVMRLPLPHEMKQNILDERKKIIDYKVQEEFQQLIQNAGIDKPIYSIDNNPGYFFNQAVEMNFFELVRYILNNYNITMGYITRAFRNSIIQGYKRIYIFLFVKYNLKEVLIEMIKTLPVRRLDDIQNLGIIKRWINLIKQYELEKNVTRGDFVTLIRKLNGMEYNISSNYLSSFL